MKLEVVNRTLHDWEYYRDWQRHYARYSESKQQRNHAKQQVQIATSVIRKMRGL